jgi:uncharacterized protein YaaN involved in tellurite resistance
MSDEQTIVADRQYPATDAIRKLIVISDTAQILAFGEQAQRDVASFADKILQQTRGRALGDTAGLLSDLMSKAKGLDFNELQNANPIMRLVGGVRRRFIRFRSQFQTVASQIDAISDQLQIRLNRMRDDMKMMDGLHAQATASIGALDEFIAVGQNFVDDYRARELPKLASAAASSDMMKAQEFQDATQSLDRLEKRIHTLRQARQIAIQQLPQIRVVQHGDATLIESLGASITLTIPAWKQKMVLILGLERQREALAMQKAVTDTTNELIRRSAEMLKIQALEIERESQRGVVDVAVLAKANQDLIDTISGVLRLQSEGHDARIAAAAEMDRQTHELRATLARVPVKQIAA